MPVKASLLRRRVGSAFLALAVVLGGGTLGYWAIGLRPLDALYQTVTTVSTVGFRELYPSTTTAKVFTIVLILLGVGTVLYAFSVVLEVVIEGDLFDVWGRRRVERKIDELEGHVIVCGYGRVGRSIARRLSESNQDFVIVDEKPERFAGSDLLTVAGDATDDLVLRRAGIERARALVAATSTDTTNVYLSLSGKALKPDLFVIARARDAASEAKLIRAGADRVINPQAIGGTRIAAMLMQPHVSEFLDVVSHGNEIEFRLGELTVGAGSPVAGRSLREAHLRERTGTLVLAIRDPDGRFHTNPAPETVISAGDILIVIGTAGQVESLLELS